MNAFKFQILNSTGGMLSKYSQQVYIRPPSLTAQLALVSEKRFCDFSNLKFTKFIQKVVNCECHPFMSAFVWFIRYDVFFTIKHFQNIWFRNNLEMMG